MLPSLTRRLRIALHATHITMTTTGRGWRPVVGAPVTVRCPVSDHAAGWKAPLEALRLWLGAEKVFSMEVEVVVSDCFAHFVLIPWSDDVQTGAEVAALARASFDELFGVAAKDWEVQVDMRKHGVSGIACALDRALLQELAELCGKRELRLTAVAPSFMDVFNRWNGKIGESGLIAMAESGRCVLACIKRGQWHSIRAIAAGSNPANDVGVLIERELLLQGMDADVPLYVHKIGGDVLARLRQTRNVAICGADGGMEAEVLECAR